MIPPEAEPADGIREDALVWVPMPDGARLAARIWRPTEGAHPAILEALPYRRMDGTAARDALTQPWMAARGYACVRLDLRGSGDSDGLMGDEYDETELSDIEAAIAWIAAQDWCDGGVGMMGISWGGFNGLMAAMRRPPALRAVISVASAVDRFGGDIHFKGGAMLGANLSWAAQMLSYQSRPPDPASRADWREVWLERLRGMPDFAARWHAEQTRSDHWRHGSLCDDYGSVEVPVLAVAGWADGYRNAPSSIVGNVAGAKGIVGPWIHKYPHFAAPEPRIGFLQEALAFWDRHLKGREGPDLPDMRLWLMDTAAPARFHPERPGRWLAFREWPPETETRTLGLAPGALGEEAALDAVLGSDPETGAASGIFFPYAFDADGPADQAPDDARAACFDGPVLEAPLDLVGRPVLRLTVSCPAATGLAAARLCELRADGTSLWLTHGILNLSHRDGSEAPEPMPDGPVEVAVALDEMACRLAPGSRLRLAVSDGLWPFVWPVGGPVTLHGGSLDLPVPAEMPGGWSFEPPVGSAPREAEVLRPGAYERREEVGRITILSDSGETRDASGLTVSERSEEVWGVSGPSARIVWEQGYGRGDVRVRTRAETSMTADADAFHIETRLTAWEGEAEVHDETRRHRIPRRLV